LLTGIAESGGEIMLIIHLPGDDNMGSTLPLLRSGSAHLHRRTPQHTT
jgi:hypothetical protein